jgi:hypothetical protein
MTLSRTSLILAASLFPLMLSLAASAQAPGPNQTEWENEALKLRLFYPSDLVKADTAQVMHDGHFTLFGISGTADPKLAEATRCLRPELLLQLPQSGPSQTTTTQPTPDDGAKVTITPAVTATILLADLDIDCLSQHQFTSTTLLSDMAEIVTKVPGMKPIAQPSTYTVGWQKVHMAAAQGQPQAGNGQPQVDNAQPQASDSAPTAAPQQLYTMGLSTNWNNHLLVWYFSSNNIDTLNRITKTTARFGRAEARPLYSVVFGTEAPLAPSLPH